METFRKNVEEAAAFLASKGAARPEIGFILGTGLGDVGEAVRNVTVVPYEEIPHFPKSTVVGHYGRLVLGEWAGKPVVVMQGRFHLYEGYTARQISFPIRVLAKLGIRALVLTNAAGGLDPLFSSGDIFIISDHINLTGHNPLVGPNVDDWGERFPHMTEPYSRRLQDLARRCALAERIPMQRGIFAGLLGPNLETAAETRFLRAIGADAVGMSVIMEAITAVHAGLELLGVSVITNVNLPDHYEPTPIEEIVATAARSGPRLIQLLSSVIPHV